jgi:hypothetical protein
MVVHTKATILFAVQACVSRSPPQALVARKRHVQFKPKTTALSSMVFFAAKTQRVLMTPV